ncbi:MAG: autotransporter assembly complex protein TamA [Rhizobacter sp.]|jgi:translocation and assembly module TamA
MRVRQDVARRLGGASLCLALGACGSLPTQDPNADGGATVSGSATPPAAVAASTAASAPAGGDADATYRLEVQAPGELRTLLLTYLDLSRFQGEAQAESITQSELTRLANASPAHARSLLETEGYFAAEVNVVRDMGSDGIPIVRLTVEPGPRSRVTSLELAAQGDLKRQADAGNRDAQTLLRELTENWALPPGEPFRQAAWNAAKNGTLAALRAGGYPTATWGNTEARVDARAHTVALSGEIDSGPQFILGELQIEGLERYDESVIRNVSDLPPGTPYTEKRLLDFQERLLKLGLFETVTVDIEPDAAQASATPLRVRVREQSLQQATTGFGYSDTTRFRVTLEHRHRRPFGWNGQVYNKLELGGTRRAWEGELIANPDEDGYRKLLATSLSREEAAGEISLANRVRIGRSLDTEHIERLVFGEWLMSELRRANGVEEATRALSANYHWVWRRLDSVILPTKGLSSSLQVGVGYARSNYASQGMFTRLYARNTLYWPLGGSWFTQVRVEAGQVVAADRVGIPDPLLFRAGGDESVRGYAYRTLGPTRDGVLASGRVLFTGSAEIARPFTPRLPSLWWAAFVDAGNAADTWQELDPALGYGLGLRYRSPVGPLRLDLAYGQEVRKARLHLSVGIAF